MRGVLEHDESQCRVFGILAAPSPRGAWGEEVCSRIFFRCDTGIYHALGLVS